MYILILLLLAVTSSQASNCTITSIDQITSILEQCKDITVGNLTVRNDQVLLFNLTEESTLTFNGILRFGVSIQNLTPLLRITGTDITITGNEGHVLDGQGEQYWDGQGLSGGKQKPILLQIEGENVIIKDLHIKNCPQTCVRIYKSENVIIRKTNIDVADGSIKNLGVDTHGFTVANSSDVIIKFADVVNQGDCVAVQQGVDLIFDKITCTGSQGLTVRPEWERDNFIRNVAFNNCSVIRGQTGIRVVTSPHQAQGSISTVVYKNIQLTGILFRGIDVRQDLDDEGRPTDNVSISQLNISKVYGNMTDKYVRAVYIWCGSDSCADWTWSNIDIKNAEVENACNCAPAGWSCW